MASKALLLTVVPVLCLSSVEGVGLPKPPTDEKAMVARWLVHESDYGVSATTCITERMGCAFKGQAFGNIMSVADGPTGIIYTFITGMDSSAQDLMVDPRMSITFSEKAIGGCKKTTAEDPPCARLTIAGTMTPVPDGEESETAMKYLLAKHPEMKPWSRAHSFKPYWIAKENISSFFFIDAYGGAAKITVDEYLAADPRPKGHHHFKGKEDQLHWFEEVCAEAEPMMQCHQNCHRDHDCHKNCPMPKCPQAAEKVREALQCHEACGEDHECHHDCPRPVLKFKKKCDLVKEIISCRRKCENVKCLDACAITLEDEDDEEGKSFGKGLHFGKGKGKGKGHHHHHRDHYHLQEPANGCYDMATHHCTCSPDVTEATCKGVWTDHCTSCAASSGKPPGSDDMASASTAKGCYDMATHHCTCPPDVTESTCGGVWTDHCTSCAAPAVLALSRRLSASDGCYDMATHHCTCYPDVTEATCKGVWTDHCTACAITLEDEDDEEGKSLGKGMHFGKGKGKGKGHHHNHQDHHHLEEPANGCYDTATHHCTCPPDVTASTCKGVWTDHCTSCAASSGKPAGSDDTASASTAKGCYDMATHHCTCPPDVTESTCGGLWTDRCTPCAVPAVVVI